MACPTGKKKYRNRAAALRVLEKCMYTKGGRRRPEDHRRQERSAYHCRLCNRYHLTHYEPNERSFGLASSSSSCTANCRPQ